jgi:hypothetical protein
MLFVGAKLQKIIPKSKPISFFLTKYYIEFKNYVIRLKGIGIKIQLYKSKIYKISKYLI